MKIIYLHVYFINNKKFYLIEMNKHMHETDK